MKLRPGSPEEIGIIPAAVERIRERCAEWVTTGVHPTLAVVAARKGVIFLEEAYGKFTPADDAPHLTMDAIFGLSSLSKPITSTCAMILVENGLLGLNRPLQEYIPEFVGEGKEQVMVHQLLTHTAGLSDQAVVEVINKRIEDAVELPEMDETQHPRNHRTLHYAYDAPLGTKPGEVMVYSDFGLHLVAEVVRRLSSVSLATFAAEQIFNPLGMKNTHFVVPKELQTNVVLRAEDGPAAGLNNIDLMERPEPAGGAYGSAPDMAVFGQMFLNQGVYGKTRVLSPATVTAMTRNQLPGVKAKYFDDEFPNASWGLGWSVNAPYKGEVYGEQLLSHSYYVHGGSGGVVLWIDPVQEIVGVFFSVLTKTLDDRPLLGADLFMNMVASAVEEP
jgi:CubicO group peptidase (beta-lactamase class C family)